MKAPPPEPPRRPALPPSKRILAASAALTLLLAPPAVGQRTSRTERPRFDRVLLLEQTAETSANVSIGDLNGDGHPDLVLASWRRSRISMRAVSC